MANAEKSTENATLSLSGIVYIQNEWHCPYESRCGMWLSFSGNDGTLSGENDLANKVGWELVPAGGGLFYLRNTWRCSTHESRCYMWLSFSGHDVNLCGRSDYNNRVPWALVPSGTPGTYYIQNKWRCGSDSRCNYWLSFSGRDAELVAPSDTANKVPWKLVGKDCKVSSVKGQWKYYHSISSPQKEIWTHGTSKQHAQSKTESWSSSMTTEVQAGFEFEGFSESVKVSQTVGRALATAYSTEWTTSSTHSFEVDFTEKDRGKVAWQFRFEPHDSCDHTEDTLTKEFAITANAGVEPCCLPGYATDIPNYSVCTEQAAMVPGGSRHHCRVATEAELTAFNARKKKKAANKSVVGLLPLGLII